VHPARNSTISAPEMEKIRASYDEIFERCRDTYGCFIHAADPRNALDVPDAEREASTRSCISCRASRSGRELPRRLTNRAANDTITQFVIKKIRARVKDPKVADLLIPKNHGYGTRRVPLESGYYEVYNQPNVKLVDLRATRSTHHGHGSAHE